MFQYINIETGETADILPSDIWDYSDIAPWKRIEDVTVRDLCTLIGKLHAALDEHLNLYRDGHYEENEDD